MTPKKAIPDVAIAPSGLLIIEECWPLLSNQCPVHVLVVLEFGNGPVCKVSLGARGMGQCTHLGPLRMHQDVGGEQGIER